MEMVSETLRARLNSTVTGTDSPSFVFVHGFGCGIDDWAGQVEALSASNRCIALDLPWHGSSNAAGKVSIATLGAAVNRVIDEHAVSDAILVGHSLGARVIREAYAQRSSNIAALVLVDGTMYVGDESELIRHVKGSISAGGFGALSDRLFADMFTAGCDPAIPDNFARRAKLMDPSIAEALMLDLIRWDIGFGEKTLQGIEVPTMAIQATYFNSKMERMSLRAGMTSPFLEIVKRCIPHAQIQIVPESGHFPMIEATETVNSLLREFAECIRQKSTVRGAR
jgi:pimeloyl-ACP methyl ester carboxylesterase